MLILFLIKNKHVYVISFLNINKCLYVLSFLHTEMAKVVQIPPDKNNYSAVKMGAVANACLSFRAFTFPNKNIIRSCWYHGCYG